jgi:hypothetical protein
LRLNIFSLIPKIQIEGSHINLEATIVANSSMGNFFAQCSMIFKLVF